MLKILFLREKKRERETVCYNYLKTISKTILYIIEKLRYMCYKKKTLTLARGKITDLKVIKE